ncbi:MAG: nucleoside-triphosphatase [Elusimicrobiota bacterium]
MEINKLIIIFDSYKQKKQLLETIILPYRDFLEGYYSTEIRNKKELKGYEVIYIGGEKKILASNEILSNVSFNKYAVSLDTIEEISHKIPEYITTPHKIVLMEVGSIFLLSQRFINNLIKALASDKKAIIFAKKTKEIEFTLKKLDDSLTIELTKKTLKDVKKITDKWLGNLINRMEINE